MAKTNTSVAYYVEKEELKYKLRQESLGRWKEAEENKVVAHDKVIGWLDSWGKEDEKCRP